MIYFTSSKQKLMNLLGIPKSNTSKISSKLVSLFSETSLLESGLLSSIHLSLLAHKILNGYLMESERFTGALGLQL